MSVSDDVKTAYELVVRDLETEKQQLCEQNAAINARIKELHSSIQSLRRRISPETSSALPPSSGIRFPNKKYVNVSVRWAILDLLNGTEGTNTSEIADSLLAGGIQTKAANFANNVSAVLDAMTKKSEVHKTTAGVWQLTETGKSACDHIWNNPKNRRRNEW